MEQRFYRDEAEWQNEIAVKSEIVRVKQTIFDDLDILSNYLGHLEETISKTAEQLRPVLRGSEPAANTETGDKRIPDSPLREQIYGLSARVLEITDQLRSLQCRIDL